MMALESAVAFVSRTIGTTEATELNDARSPHQLGSSAYTHPFSSCTTTRLSVKRAMPMCVQGLQRQRTAYCCSSRLGGPQGTASEAWSARDKRPEAP